MKILYVEDEKYLADAVIHLLRRDNISVDWVSNGTEGLNFALQRQYDCMVLDIMLPEMSGLEILQSVRQHHIQTPIILLSALSEVEDKVRGLNQGADDYLAKPFKTSELIARLRALARRPSTLATELIKFGDLNYDPKTALLNESVTLTAKESAILQLLIQNHQRILSKAQILHYAWSDNTDPEESYVEAYISRLRNKLRQINSIVSISAVRNLGYRIISQGVKDV